MVWTLKNQIQNKLGLKQELLGFVSADIELKNQIQNKLGLKLNYWIESGVNS